MQPGENPFDPADATRHALWERHIRADIDSFIAGDWDAVAKDFDAKAFQAIDARFSANPSDWTIGFPNLAAYRARWLDMSAETRARADLAKLRQAMFAGVRLARIDFYDHGTAILHKVFDGATPLKDGSLEPYGWQSLFTLRNRDGEWKITSFVGYMGVVGQSG